MSNTPQDSNQDQIISYFTLRVLIGAAGILLPLLLVIGKFICEGSLQLEYSISDYYDNGTAGDILVGVLFSLAFFLFSYKGYERIDHITATLGCIFALGVALCPTTNPKTHIIHFVFAVLLFSVFIFFSLYLFRQSDKSKGCTQQKKNRNKIYLLCGIVMSACIAGIAATEIPSLSHIATEYHIVFWLESLALFAFGFSWITKAEFLFLKDDDSAEKGRPF